jgi:hypothetical protein
LVGSILKSFPPRTHGIIVITQYKMHSTCGILSFNPCESPLSVRDLTTYINNYFFRKKAAITMIKYKGNVLILSCFPYSHSYHQWNLITFPKEY